MTQSANFWKALPVWTLGSRRDTIKWRYQVAWSVPRALRCSWTSARKLKIKWWSLSTNVRPLLKVETQQQHSEIGSVHSGVLCRSGQREQQCKSNERPTCEREWHAEGSQISIGRVTWWTAVENEGPLQKQVIVSHPRSGAKKNSTRLPMANLIIYWTTDWQLCWMRMAKFGWKCIKGIFSKMSIIHDLHMILQSNEANHNFRGE